MQHENTGLPIKSVKSFMSKIPSVFTGGDLIQWILKTLDVDDTGTMIIYWLDHQIICCCCCCFSSRSTSSCQSHVFIWLCTFAYQSKKKRRNFIFFVVLFNRFYRLKIMFSLWKTTGRSIAFKLRISGRRITASPITSTMVSVLSSSFVCISIQIAFLHTDRL